MQSKPQASFSRNRILSTLDPGDFDLLMPHLERVTLQTNAPIEEANQPIEFVYFPEPSVVSVVALTGSGEMIEVGIVGPEGITGLSVLHGSDRSPLKCFVQIPGDGIRIAAAALRSAMDDSPKLRSRLLLYAQAFSVQVSYSALSYGRFALEERLARWLLMCHDRVDGNVIPLTHEFLSVMLGVRRAGVTTALHMLEGNRAIRATRSRIEILDRVELQEAAGGSYGPPEAEYERLFALAAPAKS